MSRLPRLSGGDCVKALGKTGFYQGLRCQGFPSLQAGDVDIAVHVSLDKKISKCYTLSEPVG